METLTSIIQDLRRPKKDKTYPIKLRVYSSELQKAKLYATKYDYTEGEFASIWTEKPRKENKEIKQELQALELRAANISKDIKPFSFEQFEKRFLRNSGDGSSVLYYYNIITKKLRKANEHSTADNFDCSLNSFLTFLTPEEGINKGKRPKSLLFREITPAFLEDYEAYMLGKGRSLTTVSMYTRTLRQAFNIAIAAKDITEDLYPFGKDKYQPASVKKVKKALKSDDLKKLFNAEPETLEQKEAKGYWFFSYACNGLNMKDITLLQYENMDGDLLVVYRAKTKKAKKTKLTPLTIYLNSYAKQFIDEYGNPDKTPSNYIFPIIDPNKSSFENHRRIKNFITAVNQNLRKLIISEGLNPKITTYWARHSFATTTIRNGASMEFVSEAFGHADMKTTQGYFDGFENEAKREFMQKLMNF